jgi:type VI secretion system secreted protein VgrG
MTPWICPITPYAGKGKGMHIVPEIGEEVIVTFENGNAEKPVSLGAMFNGEAKSGHGGKGNYMKGLQTASGNKLLMNDQKGSVLLEDHGQTSMKFDGAGNSSIGTSSSQVITVGGCKEAPDGKSLLKMDKDGNINLEGKTKITLKVGNNTITLTKDGIFTKAETGEVKTIAKAGSVTIKSESDQITISASTANTIEGADIQIFGNGSIIVDSPDTDIT